jgi:hypothetical protein
MTPAFRCSRILLLLPALSTGALGDEYATTNSGRRVLLRDNGTWIDASPSPKGEQGGLFDAEQILKEKCVSEWPTDFNMQELLPKATTRGCTDTRAGQAAGHS